MCAKKTQQTPSIAPSSFLSLSSMPTGRNTLISALALAVGLSAGASWSAQPVKGAGASKSYAGAQVATAAQCTGTFTDGKTSINVAKPVFLNDVPEPQEFCDFHTFAWNQFIYLTQMQADPQNGNTVTPLFLHLAPSYNVLLPKGSEAPGAYPGKKTELDFTKLSTVQAGTKNQLVDVAEKTVLYDIRFNKPMYDAIVNSERYTKEKYLEACKLSGKACANLLWLPPTEATPQDSTGSLEVKTSWRDFGVPSACPKDTFYCNGRLGLVGMHIVQKTRTHGEWIWASFEHVANVPDCYPGGDTPIAEKFSQKGKKKLPDMELAWSFFDPKTAGSKLIDSQICTVVGSSPECNANPAGTGENVSKQVNVCRTDSLPPGDANAANCRAVLGGPPQQNSNSPGNVACLNATFRPQMDGVWKNYKMIGSLWIRGKIGPEENFTVQLFDRFSDGNTYGQPVGFPNMANTTMETWLQYGSTGYDPYNLDDNSGRYDPDHTNATYAGCFSCHKLPTNENSDDLSFYPSKLPASTQAEPRKALMPSMSKTPN
jgi:hypothetical protein